MLTWVRLCACLLMNTCASVWACVQVACESGLLGLCAQMCEPAFFRHVGVICEYYMDTTSGGSALICGLLGPGPRPNDRAPLVCTVHCVFTWMLGAQDVHRMPAAGPGPAHVVRKVGCKDTCEQPGCAPAPRRGRSACPRHPHGDEAVRCCLRSTPWAEWSIRGEAPAPILSMLSVICVSLSVSLQLSLAVLTVSVLLFLP